MGAKIILVVLAMAAIASGMEIQKRQSGPDFSNFINQVREQMKPIVEGFTSQFSNLPNLPNGMPNFPGFGGSGSSGSPAKRQATPYTFGEWFGQLGQGNNPLTEFAGNLPFKPPTSFGEIPFVGSAGLGGNQNNES